MVLLFKVLNYINNKKYAFFLKKMWQQYVGNDTVIIK